jgi:hypothetical protein
MQEGVERHVTGTISWGEDAEGIKGLPTQISLDLDCDEDDDGNLTVYDIVDTDIN